MGSPLGLKGGRGRMPGTWRFVGATGNVPAGKDRYPVRRFAPGPVRHFAPGPVRHFAPGPVRRIRP